MLLSVDNKSCVTSDLKIKGPLRQLVPTPEVALLGYVGGLLKKQHKFTAIALLLAKRERALKSGSRVSPTVKDWLFSLAYCNCELYATTLPPVSRPRDVWEPLKNNYLLETSSAPTSQQPTGIVPTGVG